MQNKKTPAMRALYLLLALVIAVGVWFYVDNYGDNGGAFSAEQAVTEIPIEYIGADGLADRGLMLLEEGTSTSVDITFEGPRLLVARLDRSKVRLTADLSSVTAAGTQTVSYRLAYLDGQGRATTQASTRFSGVTAKEYSIERATVNISELNSKEVDVRCELVGTVAEGYSAGQPELSQTTVEVQGLAEDIDDIAYAKVTLDLGDGVEETVTQLLTCQFFDANDQLVDKSGIHVSSEQIQVTLKVYVTKELQLRVNYLQSPGARLSNTTRSLEPETVTVYGEASTLKDITSITLGDFDLLELVGTGSTTHTYSFLVPDGCENLSGVTRASLHISFNDLATARIPVSQFLIDTELPDGKSAEILTEDLRISIFGTTADVESVTTEDVTATPDLSDYAAASGVYTVPVHVDIVTAGDIGISGTYQVQVRIREQAPEEQGAE